jgi:RNA polymerase sigma-70 factor (ECF subfamily)
VCLNHVSGKGPRAGQFEPLDAAPRVDGATEDAAAALLRKERAERVRAAIAQLPAKQRATLVLRVYQELPHEEIARILGTSVGASKANLFHALANLRALLKP